ncbi:variable surface protein [Plasmodium gonderi]|uniref:Variable surface protein n=1 Tax=Plasmodium gonderi TaxID=77519 RepID=A0A1Y1JNX5_PLAGO|nr:variable surface protein [Plasmodium gonderi]GAW84169.1 variable surface protein [Plasmodium gonderi]
MASSVSLHKNIDFSSIYPKCRNEYEAAKNIYRNGTPENTSLGFACMDICQELTGIRGQCSFYLHCIDTGSYLFYIKNKFPTSNEQNCEYYNYKLNEIFKNFGTKCNNNEIDCYNKITRHRNNVRMSIPDVCKGHIKKLEYGTYKIFNVMDELYKYIDDIGRNDYVCHFRRPCVKKYNDLINERDILKIQNASIYNLLDNFSKSYNRYKDHKDYCPGTPTIIDSPEEKDRKMLQEKESKKYTQEKFQKTDKNEHADQVPKVTSSKDQKFISSSLQEVTQSTVQQITSEPVAQVDTGTFAGIVFLIITVSLIIFFIYKFTALGSLLHPRVRRLKNRLIRKSTDDFNLIDSFKISQELSNHKCRLKYSLVN